MSHTILGIFLVIGMMNLGQSNHILMQFSFFDGSLFINFYSLPGSLLGIGDTQKGHGDAHGTHSKVTAVNYLWGFLHQLEMAVGS